MHSVCLEYSHCLFQRYAFDCGKLVGGILYHVQSRRAVQVDDIFCRHFTYSCKESAGKITHYRLFVSGFDYLALFDVKLFSKLRVDGKVAVHFKVFAHFYRREDADSALQHVVGVDVYYAIAVVHVSKYNIFNVPFHCLVLRIKITHCFS